MSETWSVTVPSIGVQLTHAQRPSTAIDVNDEKQEARNGVVPAVPPTLQMLVAGVVGATGAFSWLTIESVRVRRSTCELIVFAALLTLAAASVGAVLAVRRLWRPIPDDELQSSPAVWRRILNHVLGGGGLAALLVSALYGSCGWFGATCWKGGFCEAAWKGPPWILVSGLAAAPAAILLWHWRTVQRATDQKHKERELARAERDEQASKAGALAQRFAEGAKLLSEQSQTSRLAGVHVLSDVAEREPSYGEVVVDTLCSFIEQSSYYDERVVEEPDESADDASASAEAAFRLACLLGVRTPRAVRLSDVNLCGIDASNIVIPPNSELRGVRFERIKAVGLSFADTSLSDVIFWRADLTRANFSRAKVNANFFGAKIDEAQFAGANLEQANHFSKVSHRNTTYDDATIFGHESVVLEAAGKKLSAPTAAQGAGPTSEPAGS